MHLALFDVSANIHRNYKIAVKKVNPSTGYLDGVPIYSVKNTLLQIYKEIGLASKGRGNVTHLLIVLDHEDDNFRHELYPEYKANRPPEDIELTIQKLIIERCIHILNYVLVKVAGFEADDVIGSVAKRCSLHGIMTTIFSRDKDLFVLIDEFIGLFDGCGALYFDVQAVFQNKGVYPHQIEDMLTLLGDTSDNVIGVERFGKKNISTILSHFTLDELLADPSLILTIKIRGGKGLHEKFVESIEQIKLMRQVIALRTDLDLKQSLTKWRYNKSSLNIDYVINRAVTELKNERVIN